MNFKSSDDQDFSSYLFQIDDIFSSNQSRINFIQNELLIKDKSAISPWNQLSRNHFQTQNLKDQIAQKRYRKKINQYISTMNMKEKQIKCKFNKTLTLECENEIELNIRKQSGYRPFNSTVITFPRQQFQPLNPEKQPQTWLQQLYKKRQKTSHHQQRELQLTKISQKAVKISQNALNSSYHALKGSSTLYNTQFNPLKSYIKTKRSITQTLITLQTPQKLLSQLKLNNRSTKQYIKNPNQFQQRMKIKNKQFIRKTKNSNGLRKLNKSINQDIGSPQKLYQNLIKPKQNYMEESGIRKDKLSNQSKLLYKRNYTQIKRISSNLIKWKALVSDRIKTCQIARKV